MTRKDEEDYPIEGMAMPRRLDKLLSNRIFRFRLPLKGGGCVPKNSASKDFSLYFSPGSVENCEEIRES